MIVKASPMPITWTATDVVVTFIGLVIVFGLFLSLLRLAVPGFILLRGFWRDWREDAE